MSNSLVARTLPAMPEALLSCAVWKQVSASGLAKSPLDGKGLGKLKQLKKGVSGLQGSRSTVGRTPPPQKKKQKKKLP